MEVRATSYVYSSAFLEHIRERGIDVMGFIDSTPGLSGACFWYPDGSLEIAGEEMFEQFEQSVAIPCGGRGVDSDLNGPSLWGGTVYTSLSHHPPWSFTINLYGNWAKRLREEPLCIETWRGIPKLPRDVCESGDPPEDAPHNSLITIEFARKLQKSHLDIIVKRLQDFFPDGHSAKYFDDGPITLRSEISVARNAIQFRLDTSQCGNRTMVWFILSLLRIFPTNPMLTVSFLTAARFSEGEYTPRFGVRSWEEHFGPFDRRLQIGITA